MLISKAPVEQEIVSFRLSSGEEIVGRLSRQSDETIEIDKPISIAIQMVQPGQAGITFMPFMASVDDTGKVTFYRANLVTVPTATRPDVAKSYAAATSSIELPTTPGLIIPR